MSTTKAIALVAHYNRKKDLIEWVEWNYQTLIKHRMVCAGTTGRLVEKALLKKLEADGSVANQLDIVKLKSGPLGGDQQLGALIVEGGVDIVIFFWDPMQRSHIRTTLTSRRCSASPSCTMSPLPATGPPRIL